MVSVDSNQLIFGFLPTTVSKSEIEISKLFSASILFDVASANLALAWKTSVLVISLNSNLFSVASNFLLDFSHFSSKHPTRNNLLKQYSKLY